MKKLIGGVIVIGLILGAIYLIIGGIVAYNDYKDSHPPPVPAEMITYSDTTPLLQPDIFGNFNPNVVLGIRIRVSNNAPYPVKDVTFRVDFYDPTGRAVDNRIVGFGWTVVPGKSTVALDGTFTPAVTGLPNGWRYSVQMAGASQSR